MNNEFDDIRPYFDSELPASMQRIVDNPIFTKIAEYIYPGRPADILREKMLSLKSVREFQSQVMYDVNKRIIDTTISDLGYGGIENIDPNKAYLYVANHRDIMLDASLLQNIFMDNNIEPSKISFGANLIVNDIMVEIARSNKMFKVERPDSDIRKFYRDSAHLSQYVRYSLTEEKSSVWIAQRNGRTKDGNDRTDRGIISMFRMSGSEDLVRSIAELNILPVTVSYEWEPCDIQKACEIYATRRGPYTKAPYEDLNSILTGIMSVKGRVHYEFSKPFCEQDFAHLAELSSTDFNLQVAALIDAKVCSAYHLWPNNYIAHDMLNGSDEYASQYTAEDKQRFVEHIEKCEAAAPADYDRAELREILLGIYANAVDSKNTFSL